MASLLEYLAAVPFAATASQHKRAAIDKAARLVIPKPLRDHLGLVPGEVEVVADGAGLGVTTLAGDSLGERHGLPVIPAGGAQIDDAAVRTLRDAGQR
ncbi:AbrB/MazE/SpoVT family DNA-binding domain-containing protein [Mycobacterium canetti]|uniref:AbrB/MazE/SpoVT family DNA-binding domain-containing protein n=1 Tax=Mycobacterium canetti TaxID=78331 RepID=UPI001EE66EEB|nr:AbrB/MazE/SpoVT family DNA-binding domain-containing protein [Mycobacterium canetti]